MALVPPQTEVDDFFSWWLLWKILFFLFFIKMIHGLLDTELS